MKILSIVVTVYNLEKYIVKCLDSLLNQDLSNEMYEIIIVNDGSTDDSRSILDKYDSIYENIKLINIDNNGVSNARNVGIDNAVGKYLIIVDGDDYIEKECLKYITDIALEYQSEVSLFSYRYESEKKTDYKCNIIFLNGIELYKNYRNKTLDSSCQLVINTKFLKENNLKYTTGIPYLEDGEFIARLMVLAQDATYCDYAYYIRVSRPGSATQSNLYYTEKAIKGFVKAAINLKLFRSNYNLNKKQLEFMNNPITKYVITSVIACLSIRSIKYIFFVDKEFKKNDLLLLDVTGCNTFYVREASIYNISIYVYLLYKIINNLSKSLNYKLSTIKKNIE